MATKIKGKQLAVWTDGKVVTGAIDCTLTSNCDLQEISSPSSSEWKEYIKKRKGWQLQCNHLLALDNTTDFTTLLGKKVWIDFAKGHIEEGGWVQDTSNILKFSGWAICSRVEINAQNKDLAKGGFLFTGTGPLTPTTR